MVELSDLPGGELLHAVMSLAEVAEVAARGAHRGMRQRTCPEGKIAHVGLSEVSIEELEEARLTASIAAVQNLYNMVARDHDPLLDHAAASGIAFLPFFPLAIGDLARRDSIVASIARELDATPSQVALAWLLRRAPHMLPLPGTTSVSHLEQNVRAGRLVLSDDQFQRISDDGA